MSWLGAVPATLLALALLALPGLALGRAAGLRGWWLAAGAGPLSYTVIGVASVLAPMVGLGWSPLPVLAMTAVGVGAAAGVRRLLARSVTLGSERTDPRWFTALAVTVPVLLATGVAVAAVVEPANISGTFDNNFHLNAIRYILDTGNASPLNLLHLVDEGARIGTYPSLWHATGALVVLPLGVESIPVAVNAVTIVTAAGIWPLGLIALTRTVFPGRPAMLAAGVLASAFPSFPQGLWEYGALYPLFLGLAGVPFALMLVVALVRPAAGGARWLLVGLLVALAPGLALAHPGAFMVALTFGCAAAGAAVLEAVTARGVTGAARWRAGLLGVGLLVGWLGAMRLIRPPTWSRGFPTTASAGQAIGEALTLSMTGRGIAYVASALTLIGTVLAVRASTRAHRQLVAVLAVSVLLYGVAAGMSDSVLRDLLTGPWYNNPPRLAAFVAVAAAPVAAYGAQRLWGMLAPRSSRAVLAALALVLLVVGSQAGAMQRQTHATQDRFVVGPESPLLSTDELALIRRLPQHVRPGEVLVGNPWTGPALAYALEGVPVLFPHIFVQGTPDRKIVKQGLAGGGTEVCDAVRRQHLRWVLDFGTLEVNGGAHPFPGLEDLATSPILTLVDSQGEDRLYEITGCG